MKKIWIGLAAVAALLIALGGVLAGRAAMLGAGAAKAQAAPQAQLDLGPMIERFSQALKFPTVSNQDHAAIDRAAFEGLHRFLETSYPKFFAAAKLETVSEFTLLFEWQGTDASLKPALMLAHMDVVPAAEANWAHPPFGGEIHDGQIWGRGALDDKASVMGILEAAERLAGEGFKPKRTIYFSFGHDEEIGGKQGAVKVAELLKSRGVELESVLDEGMAVTDGLVPGVAAPVALIGIAEKGYVSLKLTVKERGGHSSQPPEHTAIGILAEAVTKLEREQMPADVEGPVGEMFAAVAPHMDFKMRLVFANLWLFRPVVKGILEGKPETNATIRTTTAATMIEGGVKDNVLPQSASAVVNFRIHPRDSVEGVIEHVRRAVNDPRVEVEELENGVEPTAVSPVDSDAYRGLSRSIGEVYADAVVAPALVLGGTDSRHFGEICKNILRFQPLKLGSEDLKIIHGTDERVSTENYGRAVQFYSGYLQAAAE